MRAIHGTVPRTSDYLVFVSNQVGTEGSSPCVNLGVIKAGKDIIYTQATRINAPRYALQIWSLEQDAHS